MARRPGAVIEYTCRRCGAKFPTFADIGRHAAEHKAAGATRRPRASRRIEDVSGAPDTLVDPSGPAVATDAPDSLDPEPTGGRLRPSRPQLSQPSIRLSPEMEGRNTADAVRDALPLQTVADLIRSLSVALSEADGAGPAGYLSDIQCTQVAYLIHDSTVGFVVSRFEGRVDRFKLAMAVLVILASKGQVHAKAIGARMSERQQAVRPVPVPLPAPDAEEMTQAGPLIPGFPIPPGMADTYADALARQAEMQGRPS